MDFTQIIDFFLHIDRHLADVILQYQYWTYLLLFIVIFCETGLVITPFLPGDSLLFAAGALAASTGSLDPNILALIIALAAIIGDTVNYWIGHKVGESIFKENAKILKRKHLEKTHRFYEKYGGKTIIIARFVPFVRTFAPFVAGVGTMHYGKFIIYNIIGGIVWTCLFIYSGYFFGNIPIIKDNFTFVVLAIIFISIIPIIIELIKKKYLKKNFVENTVIGN
jgi:membrane-associated protein